MTPLDLGDKMVTASNVAWWQKPGDSLRIEVRLAIADFVEVVVPSVAHALLDDGWLRVEVHSVDHRKEGCRRVTTLRGTAPFPLPRRDSAR